MTATLTYNELQRELDYCTGTEHYYNISPFTDVLITDGVRYFAEKCNCFWLFQDFIGLEGYNQSKKQNECFTVVDVVVDNDHIVNIRFSSDTGRKPYWQAKQQDLLEYIPIGEYKFYLDNGVILLPSEH